MSLFVSEIANTCLHSGSVCRRLVIPRVCLSVVTETEARKMTAQNKDYFPSLHCSSLYHVTKFSPMDAKYTCFGAALETILLTTRFAKPGAVKARPGKLEGDSGSCGDRRHVYSLWAAAAECLQRLLVYQDGANGTHGQVRARARGYRGQQHRCSQSLSEEAMRGRGSDAALSVHFSRDPSLKAAGMRSLPFCFSFLPPFCHLKYGCGSCLLEP